MTCRTHHSHQMEKIGAFICLGFDTLIQFREKNTFFAAVFSWNCIMHGTCSSNINAQVCLRFMLLEFQALSSVVVLVVLVIVPVCEKVSVAGLVLLMFFYFISHPVDGQIISLNVWGGHCAYSYRCTLICLFSNNQVSWRNLLFNFNF